MSKKKLVVVVGAGASFDCIEDGAIPANKDFQPPFVEKLFSDKPSFNKIISRYPKAILLIDEIRTKLNRNIPLEKILSSFWNSHDLETKIQVRYTILYLQHLFSDISLKFIPQWNGLGTKFTTLINILRRSNFEVLFLSTNYDLFLELTLKAIYNINFKNIDDYIAVSYPWKLVKLHGSVNWRRVIDNSNISSESLFKNLDTLVNLELSSDITINDSFSLANNHANFVDTSYSIGNKCAFPALALPLEEEKSYVCPESHLIKAKEFLKDCHHLLSIGFSGKDVDVLDLIKDNMERIATLRIVVGDKDAEETKKRFYDYYIKSHYPLAYDDKNVLYTNGFSKFIGDKNGFESYLEEIVSFDEKLTVKK